MPVPLSHSAAFPQGGWRCLPITLLTALALAACGDSTPPQAGATPRPPSPPPTVVSAGDCAAPALKTGSPGPATDAAAGRGQMFEQIELPGITDIEVGEGSGGIAMVDLDRDGLVDLFSVGESGTLPGAFRMYRNRSCWGFERQDLTITVSGALPDGNHAIPVFADFNNDGLLDFFLTGDPAMTAPGVGSPHPYLLFLAQSDYQHYEEVAPLLGINGDGQAYSRQSAIADVNGDGHLDIAIAADQIGDRTFRPGVPWQRLYIYQPGPAPQDFKAGHFVDIGGTELIPGFGGAPNSDPEHDRASPTVLLRDLDDDGDLDLVQSYHTDMLLSQWFHPHATGEYRHGVYVWKNRLREQGGLQFEPEQPGTGGLAEIGWSRYNPLLQIYQPVQHAVSHPYLSSADIDNDGDLDLLTVGPTDLEWHVHTDQIAAKFWRNEGAAGFRPALAETGLDALDWDYDRWSELWGAAIPLPTDEAQLAICALSNQKPKCLTKTTGQHQFYHADSVWADFNNDGWIDLLAVDRHETSSGFGLLRNVLLLNRGNGSFEPLKTEVSGIEENSIAAETADLNGDGLLDLYFMTDISNSYPIFSYFPHVPDLEFKDKVYWNTGEHGGRSNHWLQVQLTGLPQGQLIGSKLLLSLPGRSDVQRRDLFPVTSYKSSVAQQAHFGLGTATTARLRIVLPSGRELSVAGLPADAVVEIDARDGRFTVLRGGYRQALDPEPTP